MCKALLEEQHPNSSHMLSHLWLNPLRLIHMPLLLSPRDELKDKRNLNSKQQLFGLKRHSHRRTLADNTKLHGRQVLISYLFYSEAKKKKLVKHNYIVYSVVHSLLIK